MPLDDLLEGPIMGVLRLIGVLLRWLFAEIFVHFVLRYVGIPIGWTVLKIFSVGSYPKETLGQAIEEDDILSGLLGFFVLLAPMIYLVLS